MTEICYDIGTYLFTETNVYDKKMPFIEKTLCLLNAYRAYISIHKDCDFYVFEHGTIVERLIDDTYDPDNEEKIVLQEFSTEIERQKNLKLCKINIIQKKNKLIIGELECKSSKINILFLNAKNTEIQAEDYEHLMNYFALDTQGRKIIWSFTKHENDKLYQNSQLIRSYIDKYRYFTKNIVLLKGGVVIRNKSDENTSFNKIIDYLPLEKHKTEFKKNMIACEMALDEFAEKNNVEKTEIMAYLTHAYKTIFSIKYLTFIEPPVKNSFIVVDIYNSKTQEYMGISLMVHPKHHNDYAKYIKRLHDSLYMPIVISYIKTCNKQE